MRIPDNTWDAPAQESSGGSEQQTGTVRLGENKLSEVAERLGVNLQKLLDANPQIKNPEQLKVGQDVNLPGLSLPVNHAPVATNTETAAAPALDPGSFTGRRLDGDLGAGAARARFDYYKVGAGPADTGGIPAPKNLGELAADKVAKRINDRLTQYPAVKLETYPKLSNEEQAAADIGLGLAKYKEEVDYAKQILEYAKVLPDGPLKRQVLAKLGTVAEHLGKISDVLGKAGKITNTVKDAIGFAQSLGELSANMKKWSTSNPDPKTVLNALDSLDKTTNRAKNLVDQFGGWLMKRGTQAGVNGAMVLAYVTTMVQVGIALGKAGVQAEKAYFDKMKQRLDEIDSLAGNGHVQQSDIKLPPAPQPLEDYAAKQAGELALNRQAVEYSVAGAFGPERTAIKDQFYAEHDEVHTQFDKELFPKIYEQHRDQIMQQIRNTSTRDNMPLELAKSHILTTMEDHGPNPSPKQIQAEIRELARLESLYVEGGTSPRPGIGDERKVLSRMQGLNPGETRTYLGGSGKNPPKEAGIDTGIQKLYSTELDKYYEKKGVGVDALEKRYSERGVSTKDMDNAIAREEKRLGLD